MSYYIKISYGAAPAVQKTVSERKVAVIGKCTAFSGVIDPVTSLTDLTDNGVTSSDQLYNAVVDMISAVPNDVSIIAAGVPTTTSTVTNVEFNGDKNNSNLSYFLPYTPITTGTNPELYLSDTGYCTGTLVTATGWYDIISGFTFDTSNGVYDGTATVGADGLEFSGSALGTVSGYTPRSGDKLRADVGTHALSTVFQELAKSDHRFQFFCFAYHPNKVCSASPATSDDFKYQSGYCYGDNSWLHDMFLGANMANQFHYFGQKTQFVHSLPAGKGTNDTITGVYAAGTSYNDDSITYEGVYDIFTNYNTALAHSYAKLTASTTVAGSIDEAVSLIGTKLTYPNRRPLLFAAAAGGLINEANKNPGLSEIIRWRQAQINVLGTTRSSSTPQWHGNFTMGKTTYFKSLNYMQCVNLIAYDVDANLRALLARVTPPKFDLAGADLAIGVIRATVMDHVNKGNMDGLKSINLPARALLVAEADGTISDAQQVILTRQRNSERFEDIAITLDWKGDVVQIHISSLVAG